MIVGANDIVFRLAMRTWGELPEGHGYSAVGVGHRVENSSEAWGTCRACLKAPRLHWQGRIERLEHHGL